MESIRLLYIFWASTRQCRTIKNPTLSNYEGVTVFCRFYVIVCQNCCVCFGLLFLGVLLSIALETFVLRSLFNR